MINRRLITAQLYNEMPRTCEHCILYSLGGCNVYNTVNKEQGAIVLPASKTNSLSSVVQWMSADL